MLESTQYQSIKYSERLSEAGIDPSVGSKAEVIYRKGPWRPRESVEYAFFNWAGWFNNWRLLEPIGYVPPVEFEMEYYQKMEEPVTVAGLN